MAYRVVVAAAARDNFSNAPAYISEVLCMPRAADRLLLAFEDAVDSLEEYPAFFPLHREATKLIGREVRWHSTREYRLYFIIDEAERAVTVFSFLHRRQDVLTYLPLDFEKR